MSTDKIRLQCEACSKNLAVDIQQAGKSQKCPACGTKFVIPAAPLPNVGLDSLPQISAPQLQGEAAKTPPPAIAFDQFGTQTGEPKSMQSTASRSSTGRTIGGLIAASLVGFFCSIAWIVVLVITHSQVGILAWGIGALIGMVAGFVARNPSPIYCGLVAVIAMLSILGAKLILAAAFMMVYVGMNFVEDVLEVTTEQECIMHAQTDQWLADNALTGKEMKYAKDYNSQYFGDEASHEEPDDSDADFVETMSIAREFEWKLKSAVAQLSEAQKQQLIAKAHTRHAGWIEDENYFMAFCYALSKDPSLNQELREHALNEVRSWEDSAKLDYEQNTAADLLEQRTNELRGLVAKRIHESTPAEIDQTLRTAMTQDPDFRSDPNEFIAMLYQLSEQGRWEGELKQHADAELQSELRHDSPDYFDITDEETLGKRRREVGRIVNGELSKMDAAARKELIAQVRAANPLWIEDPATVAAAAAERRAQRTQLGDGTFVGSLQKVFVPLDILWLFLGATTAFASARRQAA